MHGRGEKMYKVLVGKSEGKRALRRLRHRWEDGIKMDLTEIGWEGVKWIHVAWGGDQWWAVVNSVKNLWVLAPQSQVSR
jgi:hypothetical protein